MESSQRFEILVTPDSGEGVHPQIMKLISNSPEGLELEMKEIPHVESALSLLKNGHGDLVAVSGKWWHENRDSSLSGKLVLPRREPTRVLVGENKPEYIPKGGIVVVDCELIKRQFLRLRNDLKLVFAEEIGDPPQDNFEKIKWLEEKRSSEKIDGYVTTRSAYNSLNSKVRRHTLGIQKDNEERFRFIPVPLEGYTVLVSRLDFPASSFAPVIDVGASLSYRLEMTLLDNIPSNLHDKIGIYIEQRKLGAILREANKIGDEFALREISLNQKDFSENKNRIELILELLNKEGTITASVDRVFSVEESHTALIVALKDWSQIIDILKENPEEEKRGRMKDLMNLYIDEMIKENRISENNVFSPKLKDDDLQ